MNIFFPCLRKNKQRAFGLNTVKGISNWLYCSKNVTPVVFVERNKKTNFSWNRENWYNYRSMKHLYTASDVCIVKGLGMPGQLQLWWIQTVFWRLWKSSGTLTFTDAWPAGGRNMKDSVTILFCCSITVASKPRQKQEWLGRQQPPDTFVAQEIAKGVQKPTSCLDKFPGVFQLPWKTGKWDTCTCSQ